MIETLFFVSFTSSLMIPNWRAGDHRSTGNVTARCERRHCTGKRKRKRNGASALCFRPRLPVSLSQPLEKCGTHDGQADSGVEEDLAEASAFIGRHKLTPGNGLRIRRAGKTTPEDRLGADAHAVMVTLKRDIFSGAAHAQFA